MRAFDASFFKYKHPESAILGAQQHCVWGSACFGASFTGVFRNQRKISLYFIQCLHSEVAWEARSSILSIKLYMNIRGLRPGGLRPKKKLEVV